MSTLALLAATAAAPCIWTYPRDLPLVETNARYWRAELDLAPGERIELEGRFPHARQMSLNLHRRADNAAVASVRDVELRPLAGSTNPFRKGARRDRPQRDYRLVLGEGAQLAPPGTPFAARLLYRIYLPDTGRPGGGVPLPRLTRIGADGARGMIGGPCPDPATVDPAQPPGLTRLPPAPGTPDDPLTWLGSATPAGQGSGDLLINRDNAYAYAMTDLRPGALLLLEGKAPTHPRTLAGQRRMGGGQVRYWSLCAYRHPSDRRAACLADEAIPLGRKRRYRVVVGPPGSRPVDARPECAIAWLEAPSMGEGVLLLRHVAPAPRFRATPLGVAAGRRAGEVLGAYEPRGRYVTHAAVEALGCAKR